MKKQFLTLGIALFAVGFCLTSCNSGKAVFKKVDATAATGIAAKKNIIVLDVRTPAEFFEGHLPNAINIDFLNPTFADKIGAMDKKKKYLVYCRSGQRSTQAVNVMQEKGFRNVTNMLGGFSQWKGQVIK